MPLRVDSRQKRSEPHSKVWWRHQTDEFQISPYLNCNNQRNQRTINRLARTCEVDGGGDGKENDKLNGKANGKTNGKANVKRNGKANGKTNGKENGKRYLKENGKLNDKVYC